MRTLLERLTEAAELAHVRIQVLPFDAGAHASMDSGFTIVGFPHEGDPDVVYLEHSTSDLYEEEAEAIQRYNLLFSYLQTKALSPEASASSSARSPRVSDRGACWSGLGVRC